MLVELALLCAPLGVVLVAASKLPASHVSFLPKSRHQKRLYRSLVLFEKLPDGVVGRRQLASDIDRQTLLLAYVTQFPQRGLDILHIVTIGGALIAALAVYYYFLGAGSFVYALALIGAAVLVALEFRRAVVNFATNDSRCFELFAQLGAPVDLSWPQTDLFHKTPPTSAEAMFRRIADIRDRSVTPMTTVEAANITLAEAASQHRHPWATLAIRTVNFTATAYDWLLRHFVGPLFKLRLWLIDIAERHRIDRADKTGNVFKAAWLARHYRNERDRVADDWSLLQHARDPLLRWVQRTSQQISFRARR
jgi:hypothetical protein